MRTISEIMKMLSKSERDTLMAAFEAGTTEFVEYTPGRFIGVGTDESPDLTCEQKAGLFREGTINVAKV